MRKARRSASLSLLIRLPPRKVREKFLLTSKLEVKAFIPMYEPLKTETCKKCKKVITQPKELIRIVQSESK